MNPKQKTETTRPNPKSVPSPRLMLVFDKSNYMMLIIAIGFIALGFILMTGGGSDDPNVFDRAMFSFRRITLAPILVLLGYIIGIYAIMKKPEPAKKVE